MLKSKCDKYKMQLKVAKYSKKSWWITGISFDIINIIIKRSVDINENR